MTPAPALDLTTSLRGDFGEGGGVPVRGIGQGGGGCHIREGTCLVGVQGTPPPQKKGLGVRGIGYPIVRSEP